MGYEQFVKKMFPFIGNQYGKLVVEQSPSPEPQPEPEPGPTPGPGAGYDVDGHHYEFKHRITAYAKPVDDHLELVVDLYQNDHLVNTTQFNPEQEGSFELVDIMGLRTIKQSDIEAKPSDYLYTVMFAYENLIRFVPSESDIDEEALPLKSFIGYPPFVMPDSKVWTASTFGAEDLYVSRNEQSETSFEIIFYFNEGHE